MLDPTFKPRWLQALRSGKYKQTTGVLRDPFERGYCCLGVACDIINPRGWLPGCTWANLQIDDKDARSGAIPTATAKLIGLNDEEQAFLANMNDEGKTFAEIANYIEAKL